VKKQLLIGAAGSAFVVLADIFAIQWSDNNNWIRAAVAGVVFVVAFCFARFLPQSVNPDRTVLSENEVEGTMSVEAGEVSAKGAGKVLSSNKTGGDFSVKVDKIDS
jgi:hypothetical protein